MGLIQTPEQLRFSYMAVLEGAKFIMGDSSVQVGEILIYTNSRSVKIFYISMLLSVILEIICSDFW